ncbi:MAG: hypothetical protein ACQEW8_10155 [Actinomycetota bacterium]
MNATNRVVNRGVLLLTGLILLALGAMAVVSVWQPVWAQEPIQRLTAVGAGALAVVGGWEFALLGLRIPGWLAVAFGAALILLTLLGIFLATRRRGRVAQVLRVSGDDGRTVVDRSVAEAVLADTLAERPDVLSAHTGVWRVRRTNAVRLQVTVARGASLERVLNAAEKAVEDWDSLLGVRVPVLIHLADRSWRDGLRSPARVR